jgi:hypothetical protein
MSDFSTSRTLVFSILPYGGSRTLPQSQVTKMESDPSYDTRNFFTNFVILFDNCYEFRNVGYEHRSYVEDTI